MMSSTLGAPLGGTTRGGHQVFDPSTVSLITPPNFGGGGGSCFPSMVVVALGEPNTPVTCCAVAGIVLTRARAVDATGNRSDLRIVASLIRPRDRRFYRSFITRLRDNLPGRRNVRFGS